MKQHKHSHQHQLPAGCHDANTAAELLGMSKKALLKRMRELGWLIVGGDAHNLPRREYVQMGYMHTQERGYALKGHQDIAKTYRVMLLTQRGFQELKRVIHPSTDTDCQQQPEVKPAAAIPGKAPTLDKPDPAKSDTPIRWSDMTPAQRKAAEAERDHAMQQLKEWGLAG